MQLIAKLVNVLTIQTGQGKNGEWKKQDIIVETDGQYPKKLCISLWGDKINDINLQIGHYYRYEIDIESREYAGRWYTEIKAWRIESSTVSNSTNEPVNSLTAIKPLDLGTVEDDDDGGLPF